MLWRGRRVTPRFANDVEIPHSHVYVPLQDYINS